MKKRLLVVAFFATALFAAVNVGLAHTAQPLDFHKSFSVTIPEGFVDGTLENFPLLVRLSEGGINGFLYSDFRQAGADILVTDANGNQLPYELENWNPEGESRLWVKVPSVSQGTVIKIYYGSDAQMGVLSGMWDGYVGVWHLNESGDGVVEVGDATVNGLSGTCHETSKAVTSGVLGSARLITSNGDNNPGFDSGITVDLSDAGKRSAVDSLAPAFTASFWFRPQKSPAYYEYLISRKAADGTSAWGLQFGKDAGEKFNQTRIYGANGSYFANSATTGTAGAEGVTIASGGMGEWHRLDCVWTDDAQYHVYVDGVLSASGELSGNLQAANGSCNLSIGGAVKPSSGKGGRGFYGDMDEVRLRAEAVSSARIAAEWRQESGTVALSYDAVQDVDALAPVIAEPSVVRTEDGSFVFSVAVSENDAAQDSVKCLVNGSEYLMTSDDEDLPKTYSVSVSDLPANRTFSYSVQAASSTGAVILLGGTDTFYTGELEVERISDGNENGLVPGVLRISRADSEHDLVVSFTLGGSANEGSSYIAIPKTVTIPAGSTYVEIQIEPMFNPSVDEDSTVSLRLSPGLYGSSSEAELTISNVKVNTWIGGVSQSASDGGNWSLGHAPLASELVCFDGRTSVVDCIWDENAPREVAGWLQDNGYTGTVTVHTLFPHKAEPDGFTNLVVTGTMTVNSGFITHPQSREMSEQQGKSWDWLGDLIANETYRLRLSVGSLRVGPEGVIDARGKGYWITHNDSRAPGCAHGGRMSADSPPCYGDPREPIHIGMGYHEGQNASSGKGGGAIYIVVSGDAVIDGTVRADAWDGSFGFMEHHSYGGAMGAAGSVFIKADAVSGTGRITAEGTGMNEEGITMPPGISSDNNYKGTGGRVAIETRVPVDRTSFAAISAHGNWQGAPGAGWVANVSGGSGTVVFRDATRPNGLLVIAQKDDAHAPSWKEKKSSFHRCPAVSEDGNWTFDAIEFGHRGYLRVPTGTTLNLPGGFASCYGIETNRNEFGGIRYEGGTIDAGANDQVLAGKWMFIPFSNYVFSANVVISNGASIGFHQVTDVFDDKAELISFPSCSFEVAGDLFVAKDGAIRATDCGFVSTNMTPSKLALGVHSHGGRSLIQGRNENGDLISQSFDSVFAPRFPGSTSGPGLGIGINGKCQRSGGAVKFSVGGLFRLDGIADVGGLPDKSEWGVNYVGGAGGSLCVTAGRIAGSGQMRADGGNYERYSGPGGRIAVRLTDSGADFSEFTGSIHAGGGSMRGNQSLDPTADASAGTVYLETASDGDKCGTVRIAMDPINIQYIQERIRKGLPLNTNTTEMVSLGLGGDDLKDYRQVNYVIADYGRGAVNTDFRAHSVKIADLDSSLDLEGNVLNVNDFTYAVSDGNGGIEFRSLSAGVYSVSMLEELGVSTVVDSSTAASGRIVVRIRGLRVTVR